MAHSIQSVNGGASFLSSSETLDDLLIEISGVRTPLLEDILRIYQQLLLLIPTLDQNEIIRLNQRITKLNSFFPEETRSEQAHLATALGNWFSQSSLYDAIHYYAIALNLEESDERHMLASSLLMTWVWRSEIYPNHLERILKNGEADAPEKFMEVLEQIAKLTQFSYQAEDFQRIVKQAGAVLSHDRDPERIQAFENCSAKVLDLRRSETPPSTLFVSKEIRKALQTYRHQFDTSQEKTRLIQAEMFENFRQFFSLLLENVFVLIGKPPCAYDLRAMGSVAREEQCPYSDLEWFILIESNEYIPYFKQLAECITLQVILLGETAGHEIPIFASLGEIHRSGLHIDADPGKQDVIGLIAEPNDMAMAIAPFDEDENYDLNSPRKSLMQSVSLASDSPSLFAAYQLKMREILDQTITAPDEISSVRKRRAHKMFDSLKADFIKHWPVPPQFQNEFNLKTQFIIPLNHLIEALGLYWGVECTNTLDVIDELTGSLSEETRELLKYYVSNLYQIRIRLHQLYKEQKDEAPCSAEQSHVFFSSKEISLLVQTYWLILYPLYNHLELFNERIDLLLQIHREQMFIHCFVDYHIQRKAPLQIHERCYRSLLDWPVDAILYIQRMQKHGLNIQELALIPGRDGWRYAQLEDAECLDQTLRLITSESQTSSVSIRASTWDLPRYLNADVMGQIMDAHGDIVRSIPDCFHNVASISSLPFDLHFKQNPNHPLMEYAIHNLLYRIAGKMTPPTELLRFEVSGRVYPVLVSQTIKGPTFKEAETLAVDMGSLTNMLLCAILTRPGDGRASNYVLSSLGRIFCVDNDISFVEPVVRKSMFSQQINFASILFCYTQKHLDRDVLRHFCELDPDAILTSWIKDVAQKEADYLTLFSEQERAEMFSDDPDESFTPTLLIKEGTLSTLYLQFHSLQQRIRDCEFSVTPFQLLESLITLGSAGEKSEIGPYIAKQYRASFRKTDMESRLGKALAKNVEKSMTSSQAQKAFLGTVPTFEEVERRQTYRLARACTELETLFLDRFAEGEILFREGKRHLHASFEKVDPARQQVVLRTLKALVELERFRNPSVVAIPHCRVLTDHDLAPFLSPQLQVLNLRNCSHLSASTIALITEKCPNLEELYLSGTDLAIFAKSGTFRTEPIRMSALRLLHVANCPALTTIMLLAPHLSILKANKNPKLTSNYIDFNIPKEAEVNLDESPQVDEDVIEGMRLYYQDTAQVHKQTWTEIALLFGKIPNPNGSDVFLRKGILNRENGDYEEALQNFMIAFAILSMSDINNSSLTQLGKIYVSAMANIGICLYNISQYEKASAYFIRLLAFEEKRLGENHLDLAGTLNNIGNTFYTQGNYDEASAYFIRLLAIEEKHLGENHLDLAVTLNNIGNTLSAQGNYDEASAYFIRLLAIEEKHLGENHLDLAVTLNNIGNTLSAQGNYDEALVYYRRELAIEEKHLGENHLDLAVTLINIGNIYYTQGNYDEALVYYRRALAIREKHLGENHLDLAVTLNNIGNIYYTQGNYDEALVYYRRALAIREKHLGDDHLDLAVTLNNIGNTLNAQGNYDEALDYYRRALAIREKHVSDDHLDLAVTLNNIGYALDAQGNYREANFYFKRGLSIKQRYNKSLKDSIFGDLMVALNRRSQSINVLESAAPSLTGRDALLAEIRGAAAARAGNFAIEDADKGDSLDIDPLKSDENSGANLFDDLMASLNRRSQSINVLESAAPPLTGRGALLAEIRGAAAARARNFAIEDAYKGDSLDIDPLKSDENSGANLFDDVMAALNRRSQSINVLESAAPPLTGRGVLLAEIRGAAAARAGNFAIESEILELSDSSNDDNSPFFSDED